MARRSEYAPGGLGNKPEDTLKALAAIASGMIAEPIAGLAGLVALPAGAEGAAGVVGRVQEALTYMPDSPGARNKLQSLGEVMEPVSAAFEAPGGYVMDKTGNPLLATLARTLTEAAPDLIPGVVGLKAAGRSMRGNVPSAGVGGKQKGMLYGSKALNRSPNATEITALGDKQPWYYEPDTGYTFDKSYMDLTEEKYPRLKHGKLKDMIKHETLFKNYPHLKNAEVKIVDGVNYRGAYDPMSGEININRDAFKNGNDPARTLLHEIQHSIQNWEGQSGGSNLQAAASHKAQGLKKTLGNMDFHIDSEPFQRRVRELKTQKDPNAWDNAAKEFGVDKLFKEYSDLAGVSDYDLYRSQRGEQGASSTEMMYQLQQNFENKVGPTEAKRILENMSAEQYQAAVEDMSGYKWADQWSDKDGSGSSMAVDKPWSPMDKNAWDDSNYTAGAQAPSGTQFESTLRRSKEGQYVGAPRGVDTPEKLDASIEQYVDKAARGIHGRNWYLGAQKFNKDITKNKGRMEDISTAFGATSANTAVPGNTGFGIKGYNEGLMNAPDMSGGIFQPSKDAIEMYYNAPKEWRKSDAGLKIQAFIDNVITGGKNQRPVHDIHDGRAFGMTETDGSVRTTGYSPQEHEWMDRATNQATKILNERYPDQKWTPSQTQAAVWTGQKYDLEMEKALAMKPGPSKDRAVAKANELVSGPAKHYGDFGDKYLAEATREMIPGSHHMAGAADLPYDVQREYSKSVKPRRQGDMLEMLKGPMFEGRGMWEGKSSPVMGSQSYLGRVSPDAQRIKAFMESGGTPEQLKKIHKGNAKLPPEIAKQKFNTQIDPNSLRAMNANEAAQGMLSAQDAMAYKMFDPGMANTNNMNAMRIQGKPTEEQMKRVGAELEALYGWKAGMSASPQGMDILDIAGDIPMGRGKKGFKSQVEDVVNRNMPRATTEPGLNLAAKQGEGYIENPWTTDKPNAGKSGQAYMDAMQPNWRNQGPPSRQDIAVEKAFNKWAPGEAQKYLKTDEAFSKKYNLPQNENITNLRKAIVEGKSRPEGAMKYIQGLMQKGILPAAVVVPVLGQIMQEEQGNSI